MVVNPPLIDLLDPRQFLSETILPAAERQSCGDPQSSYSEVPLYEPADEDSETEGAEDKVHSMLESLGLIFSASYTAVPFTEFFPFPKCRFQGVPGSCLVGTVKEKQMTFGVRFSWR